MAKKDFKTGIDLLIRSSAPQAPQTEKAEEEKTTGIHFKAPLALKRQIDVLCAKTGVRKQDFIISALSRYIEQQAQ
jgi:hypothetical protein